MRLAFGADPGTSLALRMAAGAWLRLGGVGTLRQGGARLVLHAPDNDAPVGEWPAAPGTPLNLRAAGGQCLLSAAGRDLACLALPRDLFCGPGLSGIALTRPGPAPAPARLWMETPFEIAIEGEEAGALSLWALGQEAPLRLAAYAPDRALAVLTGRIWADLPATQETALYLTRNGQPVAPPLPIRRAEVAAMIETLATGGPEPEVGDPLPLLTAVEHLRWLGDGLALSEGARALMGAVVRRYRLTRFVALPEAALPPPEDAAFARIKALVPRLVGAPPEALAGIVAQHGLAGCPPQEAGRLLVDLTPEFCAHDRMEDLLALRGGAVLPPPEALHVTQRAALLPWLRADPSAPLAEAIAGVLEQPVGDRASLGWCLRRMLTDPDPRLEPLARDRLLLAFLAWVEREARRPLGAATDRAVVQVLLEIAGAPGRLSPDLRPEIMQGLARAVALSVPFWAGMAARGRPVPPALRAARTRFAELRAAVLRDDFAAASALSAPGAYSGKLPLRRDLAAAARQRAIETTGDPGPPPPETARATPPGNEALLRHLLAPPAGGGDWRAGAVLAPPPQDLPRAALTGATELTPDLPAPARQRQAGAALWPALARADDRGDLIARLAPLAGSDCGHVGLAMGLSLLGAQALAGRGDGPLCAWLDAGLGALPPDRPAASEALASALAGLARSLADSPAPPADALRLAQRFAPALPPPGGMALGRGPRAALADLIVVVISCAAYLPDRLPRLRAAWLDRLAAAGVPWVVAVGGAPGQARLEGHILHLPVPDDYTGLPAKVLAAVAWVQGQTGYAHMLKIDDDTLVDAEGLLALQPWRGVPCLGRVLPRKPGETDRCWHHPQGGPLAQEIDKSPEPAIYAEGGTGYVLSRRAMAALLDPPDPRAAARLRAVSLMEDKLVGDLLALSGIAPVETGWFTANLRRTRPDGPAVTRWQGGVLPTGGGPVLVAHLDDPALVTALAAQPRGTLLPHRIWPTGPALRIGPNDRSLEFLGAPERLWALARAEVCVIASLRNEAAMLPAWLAHYRRLGVGGFLVADNLSSDGSREYLAAQPDVALFSAEAEYRFSQYGMIWQQALLAHFRQNRWSLVADADEFLMLPEGVADLPTLLARPAFAGAEAARVLMLDLYPPGPLAEADPGAPDPFAVMTQCDREPFVDGWSHGPYGNDRTWTSALRHRLFPEARRDLFVAQKYALMRYRPWMRFGAGLHYMQGAQVAAQELVFGHFKYHAGFAARARSESRRGQHFNAAEEYRRYAALPGLDRVGLSDPGLSTEWRDCPWLRRALGRGA